MKVDTKKILISVLDKIYIKVYELKPLYELVFIIIFPFLYILSVINKEYEF
jgi:hypothetical protein